MGLFRKSYCSYGCGRERGFCQCGKTPKDASKEEREAAARRNDRAAMRTGVVRNGKRITPAPKPQRRR